VKIKIRQIITTTVLSFVLVLFSVQGPATAAPTLKAQLQTIIKKTSATWPKIGSYSIDRNPDEMGSIEIHFYNDQLKHMYQMLGSDRTPFWEIDVYEPLYSYTPFSARGFLQQRDLDRVGAKRLDWVRFTGGYSGNSFSDYSVLPNNRNLYKKDVTVYKKLFNWPVSMVQDAITKSKSISQNKKSKQWTITGTCPIQVLFIPENIKDPNIDITTRTVTSKCSTYVDFNTNGTLKLLQQYSEVDGQTHYFEFNTPKPVAPFVDHTYVMDGETGMLAEY
jgi:hypothetical protein